MASSINASTSGAGGVITTADNTGILNIQTAGTTAITVSASQNTTFAGTVTLPTGTVYPLISGTAVASTSGTSIDFTSIPSWVKRVIVIFSGVSTNGTSQPQIQIGAGSVTTSGYLSFAVQLSNSSLVSANALTSGFHIFNQNASAARNGTMVLSLISSNTWVSNHVMGDSAGAACLVGGGSLALGGTLDRVRITTANGTDTFDAGSINILYE